MSIFLRIMLPRVTFFVFSQLDSNNDTLITTTIIMNRKRKARTKFSLLPCRYCGVLYKKGRSYSNHVQSCPAIDFFEVGVPDLHNHPNDNVVADASNEDNLVVAPPFASIPTHDDHPNLASTYLPDDDDDDDDIPFPMPDDDSTSDEEQEETGAIVDDLVQDDISVQSFDSSESHNNQPSILSLFLPADNEVENEELAAGIIASTAINNVDDVPIRKRFLINSAHYYTLDDAVHLRLLNICHEIHAPRYAFDSLLAWAQDSQLTGYQFPSSAPSRKTFMDRLYSQFHMSGAKPILKNVPLFPDKTATVVTFSFTEMVHSLLSDKALMHPDNLIISLPNESGAVFPETDDLGDIHTGSWYKAATIKLCINETDCLCPIIIFIDKTQIDALSKWSLEPVLFTLGIFNRATRNLSSAWRPAGLVTNTMRMSSATSSHTSKQVHIYDTELPSFTLFLTVVYLQGQNIKNYHRILKAILEGIVEAQKSGGIEATVPINGVPRQVTLKVPIAIAIGD